MVAKMIMESEDLESVYVGQCGECEELVQGRYDVMCPICLGFTCQACRKKKTKCLYCGTPWGCVPVRRGSEG